MLFHIVMPKRRKVMRRCRFTGDVLPDAPICHIIPLSEDSEKFEQLVISGDTLVSYGFLLSPH